MKLANLNNSQLYEMLHIEYTNRYLRNLCNQEFEKRNLEPIQLEKLKNQFESKKIKSENRLSNWNKLLLLIFPFIMIIHIIIASKFLAKKQFKKWNQFWYFICIGLLFWTFVIVILSKFSLF